MRGDTAVSTKVAPRRLMTLPGVQWTCSETTIGREGISRVSIQIFEQFCEQVSHRWLVRVAMHVLAKVASPTMAASIVIADDETLRELNARHRGVDDTTDVLAFSYTHQGEYQGDGGRPAVTGEDEKFVTPPADSLDLGEVIISYPQAERQAASESVGTASERSQTVARIGAGSRRCRRPL